MHPRPSFPRSPPSAAAADPSGDLAELAARSGARRTTLEQLAWAGACDGLAEDGQRRTALWQLGIAAPAQDPADAAGQHQTQLALPLELAPAPALRPLGRWQRLIADYSTTAVTLQEHALAILRPRLTVPMLATSAQLTRLPSGGEVAVAGLVIARQRPATASGTMFLLFEDEFGTINLIVPGRCTSATACWPAPSPCCWPGGAWSAPRSPPRCTQPPRRRRTR